MCLCLSFPSRFLSHTIISHFFVFGINLAFSTSFLSTYPTYRDLVDCLVQCSGTGSGLALSFFCEVCFEVALGVISLKTQPWFPLLAGQTWTLWSIPQGLNSEHSGTGQCNFPKRGPFFLIQVFHKIQPHFLLILLNHFCFKIWWLIHNHSLENQAFKVFGTTLIQGVQTWYDIL